MRLPDIADPAPTGGRRLLLLGACVRSLAQSALRGPSTRGHFPGGVIAVDFFGDADLDGMPVRVVSIRRDGGRDRTIANLGRAALALEWEAVAPAGGLENRPALLRLLARHGRLLGSAPEAIRAVRDAARLAAWLADADLPHAPTPARGPVPRDGRAWLLKRRRAAGGGGVRPATAGEPFPPGWYLQQHLRGRIGSAAFLADGHDAILLGVSEQLAGVTALGARRFRHAGNLVDVADLTRGPDGLLDDAGTALARRMAAGLASRFGLRGLAGFDFVSVRGRPHLIEVNPRWTASMELIEEALEASLFEAQLRVAEGAPAAVAAAAAGLPAAGATDPPAAAARILARGVLYATITFAAPDPAVLHAVGARDRPRRGEIVQPGQPLCTLTAAAGDRAGALAVLRDRAAQVRALVGAQ